MSNITITLNNAETRAEPGLVKATDFYEKLAIESNTKWLYLKQDDDIDIPLLPEDYLVIHGGENIVVGDIDLNIGENPPVRQAIRPEFNGKKLEQGLGNAKISGRALQDLDAEIQPNKLFVDLTGRMDAFVGSNFTLVVQNTDSYFTIPGDDDVIDLEKCSRANRKPPKGQGKYNIKIDGEKYTVVRQMLTGEEILAQVGKGYDEWTLNQKLRGGRRKPIEKEENIDLAQPGIERFETVRRQAQQGWSDTPYLLPEDDMEFLSSNYRDWTRQVEESKRGLVISNYRLPRGYVPDKAELMLLIPIEYPTAGIDMFYFSPDVVRADGQSIGALNPEVHFGKQWHRWSRHYDWRPGEDNIATHITYVGNQLKSELGQGR